MPEPKREPNRPKGAPQDALAGPGGVVFKQYTMLERISSCQSAPRRFL